MKNLKRILVIGERSIFDKLFQIVDTAAKANIIVKKMFKSGYNNPELNADMQAVRNLERQADEIAFQLSEQITGGAISPNLIDNLLRSVHVADDIVDLYYYLSRELGRMSKAKMEDNKTSPQAEWASVYQKLFELADQSLNKLKQALSTDNIEEILRLGKEVEAIEEEGDDIKDASFDELYAAAPKMHFLQFYHYSGLLHKTDDILDCCEDLSDLIISVVTSIFK
ncbi:MAG: DUF47 domain-containing protein [Candidatus Bathyarchaeia archaeon]